MKPSLKSPTSRARLAVQWRPYYELISPNIYLGYRRTAKGAGSWSVRVTVGRSYRIQKFALADDLEPAAPPAVLDYWQAIEVARKTARRDAVDKPRTVSEALERYRADLERRGSDPYNAKRALYHLPPALAAKPVASLTADDLAQWRDGLTAKGLAGSTVNRTRSCLRAALELAAETDPRIKNAGVFKIGLKGVADAGAARNVILDDDTVRRFVAGCYARNHPLGVLADIMSETGARPSQITRLICADFKDGAKPKLTMPRSGKGGGQNRAALKARRYTVSIGPILAATLRNEAAGRDPDDLLLTRADGQPWGDDPHAHYGRDIIKVVEAVGLDPVEIAGTDEKLNVTLYALRHSAIVRMLLRNVPIRLIAALTETSVRQIEKTYSKHITDHVDEISRMALLEQAPVLKLVS